MPKPTKQRKVKEEKIYCFACGFPVNDVALLAWLKKNKLPSLAKALNRISHHLPKKLTK